jgi:hypothetical protein
VNNVNFHFRYSSKETCYVNKRRGGGISADMNKQNQSKATNLQPQVLEQGDIYFFYRPKKDAQEVKSVEDFRRFFIVTAPEEQVKEVDNKNQLKL